MIKKIVKGMPPGLRSLILSAVIAVAGKTGWQLRTILLVGLAVFAAVTLEIWGLFQYSEGNIRNSIVSFFVFVIGGSALSAITVALIATVGLLPILETFRKWRWGIAQYGMSLREAKVNINVIAIFAVLAAASVINGFYWGLVFVIVAELAIFNLILVGYNRQRA